MAILFTAAPHNLARFTSIIQTEMTGYDLRVWPNVGNPGEIDYIISTGTAPTAHFQNLPNLKAIFLASAGVDAIIKDPNLPDVSIVRCVTDSLSQGMAEYVFYHVLKYHRDFHIYDQQQKNHVWKQQKHVMTHQRTVGVMGVGEMGLACLNALKPFGFPLRGWSRTQKDIDGVMHFAGMEQLPDFLSGCSIVVCVLPLTDETRGILCTNNLQHMPRGSYLINAGRGDHIIESDILNLLDNSHLAGCAFDVFPSEPLPNDNPLWAHSNVTITPHIASITDFNALCDDIKTQIAAYELGEPLRNVVDRERGY